MAFLLVLASPVLATDRLVPSVYSTIQAGIDAAVAGDMVIVAPGTYTGAGNKNLDFGGKAITVRSTDPNNPSVVETTVIDCQNSGRGFYFHTSEDANSIVAGLTIKRGYIKGADAAYPGDSGSPGQGGGIYYDQSSPTIKNCVITDNEARGGDSEEGFAGPGTGGGIFCGEANPKIVNCTITYNDAIQGIGQFSGAMGGGIFSIDGSPTIINCIISKNYANGESVAGGGISSYGGTITNCTVYNNTLVGYEEHGDGIHGDGTTIITNCIIWGNGDDLSYCSATYSCIEDNDAGTGNIHSDPCFVTGWFGNYYLKQIASGQTSNSPCVNAGSDSAANLGMDGLTTRIDLVGDSGTVDMGYHYPRVNRAFVDIDGDSDVDLTDFTTLGSQWNLNSGMLLTADVAPSGGDGIVDMCDLALMAEIYLWGTDPNSALLHWEFDEGSGTTAYDSAGYNDGIISGNTKWVTGRVGSYALDFDGGWDWVQRNNFIDLSDQNAITISAWMKNVDSSPDYAGVSIGTRYSGGVTIRTRPDRKYQALMEKGNNNIWSCSTAKDPNIWFHVVGVIDNTSAKIYLNGVDANDSSGKSGTLSFSDLSGAAADNLYIGAEGNSSSTNNLNQWFNGTIDDVRVYDRALSEGEIQQLYQDSLN